MMRAIFVFSLICHSLAMDLTYQALHQRQVADSPGLPAGIANSQSPGNDLVLESLKIQERGVDTGVGSKVDATKKKPMTYERGSDDRDVDTIFTSLLAPSEADTAESRLSAKPKSAQPDTGSGQGPFSTNPGSSLLALLNSQAPVVSGPVEVRHVNLVRVGLQQEILVAKGSGYLEKSKDVETSPVRRRRSQAADQSDVQTLVSGPKPVQGGRDGAADLSQSGDERGQGVRRFSPSNSRVLVGAASAGPEEKSDAQAGGRGDNAGSGSQGDAGNPRGSVSEPPPTLHEGQNNPQENPILKRAFLYKEYVRKRDAPPSNLDPTFDPNKKIPFDPSKDPDTNPKLKKFKESDMDPVDLQQKQNQQDSLGVDPNLNPGLDPKSPALDPKRNLALDPNINPTMQPGNMPANGASFITWPAADSCLLAVALAVLKFLI